MGREIKILLGMLGLLAGVFVGVLSVKLLVPRPPVGAGPDVHADITASEPQDLVAPPDITAAAFAETPLPAPPVDDFSARGSRFTSAPAATEAETSSNAEATRRDPFVTRASLDAPPAALAPAPPLERPAVTSPVASPVAAAGFGTPPPAAPAASPPLANGTGYVAQPGDSWWSLAERAYGDGRLYRALFAWNRAIQPRVSLVAGTPLEIPPLDRLRMAWPALAPQP